MLPKPHYLIENTNINPPIDPRKEREGGSLWTFDLVQERLIEAMRVCWQMPDRERGWLRVKAHWPDILRHTWFGDYGDTEAIPRPAALTRRDLAEMEQAFGWMTLVKDRDRKLVALAIAKLAAGASQAPWADLKRPLGVALGADGLRMRYGRAITSICNALNTAEILEVR